MRCKAITQMVLSDNKPRQCKFKAVKAGYCKTHNKKTDIKSLQNAFDICFHALKTITELMIDPSEEAYLIAKQTLAHFPSAPFDKPNKYSGEKK